MLNTNHSKLILSIILFSAFLGGLGNYLSTDPAVITQKNYTFFTSFILGLCAAAAVPLFLNVISSDLLSFDDKAPNLKKLLVFMSVCTLAALFSNNFLGNIYAEAFDKKFNALKTENQSLKHDVSTLLEKAALQNNTVVSAAIKEAEKEKIKSVANKFDLNNEAKEILSDIYSNKVILKSSLPIPVGKEEAIKQEDALQVLLNNDLIKETKIDEKTIYQPVISDK